MALSQTVRETPRGMMHVGVLIEVLAIISLTAGVPIPIAGTIAWISAMPTSAVAILRILKSDQTVVGAIDIAFLFFTWTLLPCLLLRYATDGVGENVFLITIAARLSAAVNLWRL